jgi:DNA-binding GntR family transcriptional regulator
MVLCDQHQQLLEAIVNGDRQKADAVLTKHLNKVQGDLEIVRKQFHHSFFQPEL